MWPVRPNYEAPVERNSGVSYGDGMWIITGLFEKCSLI